LILLFIKQEQNQMQKTVLILCSLLFFASTLSTEQQLHEEANGLWGPWKATHNKVYSDGEEAARFAIFLDNYKHIVKFNSESTSVKLALNKMADITKEEFKQKYLGLAKESDSKYIRTNTVKLPELRDLPQTVDWNAQGAVGPVKDQKQCGSCWAFSTVGALESYHYIQYGGEILSFSEQQVIDCNREPNLGCQGGYPYTVFEYASTKGLQLESDYPYTEDQGTCQYQADKARQVNIGYSFVQQKSKDMLKVALAITPTVVAVEADQSIFQFYSKGVIGYGCGRLIDHAVLAVGFDIVDGSEAFVVKNSWGTSWGVNGYFYLSTDPSLNAGYGACGVLSQAVFPF